MIGSAEIYDLMLDQAETFAVTVEPDHTHRLRWPMAAWQTAFQRVVVAQERVKAFVSVERVIRPHEVAQVQLRIANQQKDQNA